MMMSKNAEVVMVAKDQCLEGNLEVAEKLLTEAGIKIRQNVQATCGLPQVGDILSCSWGYEQTRYDYYQVVKVTKASVKILKISKTCIEGGYGFPTNAKVMPVKDSFVEPYGGVPEPMTKRFRAGGWDGVGYGCNISSYSSAHLWDGTPDTDSGDH